MIVLRLLKSIPDWVSILVFIAASLFMVLVAPNWLFAFFVVGIGMFGALLMISSFMRPDEDWDE